MNGSSNKGVADPWSYYICITNIWMVSVCTSTYISEYVYMHIHICLYKDILCCSKQSPEEDISPTSPGSQAAEIEESYPPGTQAVESRNLKILSFCTQYRILINIDKYWRTTDKHLQKCQFSTKTNIFPKNILFSKTNKKRLRQAWNVAGGAWGYQSISKCY